MASRIDIGPDGGPYVEIDESNGDLVIRTPNDAVDFNSEDLNNIASVIATTLTATNLNADSLATNNNASIDFSDESLSNISSVATDGVSTNNDASIDFSDESLSNISSVSTDGVSTNNDASIDFNSEDVTNIASLEADATLAGATRQQDDQSFGDWEVNTTDTVQEIEVGLQVQTDGNGGAVINLEIDYDGGTSSDFSRPLLRADAALGSWINNCYTSFKVPSGASFRVVNNKDPANANFFNIEQKYTL